MKKIWIICCMVSAFVLTGCITSDSANVYRKEDMRTTAIVSPGVVKSIRVVKMEDSKGIGAGAGAAVGAIAAGSNIGGGSGSWIAGILGGVVGGMVGNKVEQMVTSKQVYEITVKLNSGKLVAITQDMDISFTPGQRVHVLENGMTSRVVPAN